MHRDLKSVLLLLIILVGIWLGSPVWAQGTAPGSTLTLQSSSPTAKATNIKVTDPITLDFTQPLNPSLQNLQVEFKPDAPLSFDIQQNRLIITPTQPLQYSTQYTLTLPIQTNFPLAEPLKLTFRTAAQFSYTRDIQPLLDASCVGCHQKAGRQRAHPLSTYAEVMKYVVPGDPDSTLLNPRWTGRHAVILKAQIKDGQITGPGRSPEVAYVVQRQLPVSRLGFWTPAEIETVRAWVVKDLAPENPSP